MTLEQARERIVELEALLEHAIYVRPQEWRLVSYAAQTSFSQSIILVALYKAKGHGLSHVDMDALLPDDVPDRMGRPRKDPDFRTLSTVKQHLFRIRQRHPGWLVSCGGRSGLGVRLSAEGRWRVGEALGAS
jgi:hypothetical protein